MKTKRLHEVAAVSNHPGPTFTFLDFPIEIRIQIYALLLISNSFVFLERSYFPRHELPFGIHLHILATCRQIEREAASMLDGANDFCFPSISAANVFFSLFTNDTILMIQNVSICVHQETQGWLDFYFYRHDFIVSMDGQDTVLDLILRLKGIELFNLRLISTEFDQDREVHGSPLYQLWHNINNHQRSTTHLIHWQREANVLLKCFLDAYKPQTTLDLTLACKTTLAVLKEQRDDYDCFYKLRRTLQFAKVE